jgi:hypothetical protein
MQNYHDNLPFPGGKGFLFKIKTKIFLFNFLGLILIGTWGLLFFHLYDKFHGAVKKRELRISSPKSLWFEILFKKKKIGYLNSCIVPQESGYLIRDNLFIKAIFMGYSGDVNVRIASITDKNFMLKKVDLLFVANKFKFHISGTVKNNLLIIKRKAEGQLIQQSFSISKPIASSLNIFPFVNSSDFRVGTTICFPFLDPITMIPTNISLNIVAYERIKIQKISYHAYKIQTKMLGNPVSIWVTKNGELLKVQIGNTLSILRSHFQNAISSLAAPDLWDFVSIKTNTIISKPRKLAYLKLKVVYTSFAKIIEVRKEKLPQQIPFQIPYLKKDLQKYLLPEFNIESNTKLIQITAKKIIGNVKDPIKATKKIVDWIYENINKKPVFSFPSALETLKNREGDCNEHAVLAAALFRAVGIPSKVCVGLIYKNGRFFYHAWNEVYLGKWVPIDTTLGQFPVDAGHVVLFYGNVNKHIKLTNLILNLKEIRIMKFSYD